MTQKRRPNPLDSRFRGNDGVKIGSNSAIIASLRPLRLRAFASNSLCQHALETQRAIAAELDSERALVDANRELIRRFEAKIEAAVGRVWGA